MLTTPLKCSVKVNAVGFTCKISLFQLLRTADFDYSRGQIKGKQTEQGEIHIHSQIKMVINRWPKHDLG